MYKTTTLIGLALLAALVAFPSQALADDDLAAQIRDEIKAYNKGSLKVTWKNGLNFETEDKATKIKIGGRVMVDAWFIDDDKMKGIGNYDGTEVESGVEFRRVRLYASGVIDHHAEFKLQMEFADPNKPVFKDIYVGITDLHDCFGCAFPSLRAGHFKVPFSLEALTSSKYITFMERAAPTDAFAPSRKVGLMLHDSLRGGQLNYGVGAHMLAAATPFENDGEDFFDNGWALAGRVAYTPWNDCSCDCRFLHLGAGVVYAPEVGQTGDDRPRWRARPYAHIAGSRLVDTGRLSNVDDYMVLNGELAFVYGPWSIQGEYFLANVNRSVGTDPSFSGYYVQGSYWLTGECRAYKKGTFNRVKPCCNFLDKDCCCKGAVELAVRYDFLDLTDSGVTGGEQSTITAGVNWHLNGNMRVMLNWFLVDVTGGPELTGTLSESLMGVGTRLQVDF